MKEACGLKIPMLHPESWAIDMVDIELVKKEDAAKIMCGSGRYGLREMLDAMEKAENQ
jgi:hypothetical protein